MIVALGQVEDQIDGFVRLDGAEMDGSSSLPIRSSAAMNICAWVISRVSRCVRAFVEPSSVLAWISAS